ncbi:2'-5' RNA ligase family protein [Micromonospora sp. NPDC048843]|uniref:2'-5' RNA ligase family protein n=1 Tax=Micromonospora sp. NPDC048843 TaxID=3155389 RepID=UPI0033CEFC9E
MRLFVAVRPSVEAVNHLAAQVARLRVAAAAAAGVSVRLADPADLHLTVAFLGAVESARLVEVDSALGLAVERFRNGRDAVPRLSLGGGGRVGLDGYEGPSWPASELLLVRSHLGGRPRYERIAAWSL